MYETREEAHQKLSDTIVIYQDKPHYIRETKGDTLKYSLVHRYLKKGSKYEETDPSSKEWDFRNLGKRLGYFNYVSSDEAYQQALYVVRLSIRKCQSTQGLSTYNTKISSLKKSPRLNLVGRKVDLTEVKESQDFINMMEGVYPLISDIKKEFSENPYLSSKAFSRQFSVYKHDVGPFYLQYKGSSIGYTEDLFRWRIADDFKYLIESLESYQLEVV